MEIQSSAKITKGGRTTSISIGDSRTGKTHFIGTIAEEGRKLFVLDAEDGLKSIADKSFEYKTVNNWSEAEAVLNWYMSEGHNNYTHLAIDSLNRLQAYLVDDITSKPDEHGKNAGIMTINKFGILLAKMKKIVDVLTKICPSSVHMNVTAMESKDEVTGAVKLYPALQGSFKHEVLGYFDTILYHKTISDANGQKFWCQIGGDNRVIAGTRLAKLREAFGTQMPNDYKHIAEAMQ